MTCETEHPHHRTGWVPLDCVEFIRPANGCDWGDCTRPATRFGAGRGIRRRLCERCARVAQSCGVISASSPIP